MRKKLKKLKETSTIYSTNHNINFNINLNFNNNELLSPETSSRRLKVELKSMMNTIESNSPNKLGFHKKIMSKDSMVSKNKSTGGVTPINVNLMLKDEEFSVDPRNGPFDKTRRKFKGLNIEPNKWYEGDWIDGRRDGFGILKWNDGSVYVGYFKNDKADGFGTLKHTDGDIYVGLWLDDRASYAGKYHNLNGASYEGFWNWDKQNGYGMEIWPRGRLFEGDFIDSSKHGIGILNLEDNAYYRGEFKNNDINGIGIFYFRDGRKYEGEWINNKMNGFGILTWPDGKSFEGHFVGDKKEGFGIYYALNKIYIGFWENSKLEGDIILLEKGVVKKFYWKHGKKVKNLPSDYPIFFERLVDNVVTLK